MSAPRLLTPVAAGIPPELKKLKRWAPWEGVWRSEKAKFDKVPRDPKNVQWGLSTTKQWFTFDTAWSAYEDNLAPVAHGGVGLNLYRLKGLVVLDLDHCIDAEGRVASWAQEVVRRCNSYAETSPSGAGVRIFVRGQLPEDWVNHEQGIEVYGGASPRFVTVTGRPLKEVPHVS